MWIAIFEADIDQECNKESVKQKLRSVSFKISTQENAKHTENNMNYQAWNISALLFISLQNIPVDISTDFDHPLNLADSSHMHTTLQTALAKLLTLDYVQHSRSSMLKKFNQN